MEMLIWAGAAVTLAGVAGARLCRLVARARRAGLRRRSAEGAASKVIALNLGALFLSVIGLMMVVIGIFLS